jgi:nickel-dependent lactate racemase
MIYTQNYVPSGLLDAETIYQTLLQGLERKFTHQKVLVLIPDHTRSLPLPKLFAMLVKILHDTAKLDFLVALGTHPALSEGNLEKLVGITAEERNTIYRHVGLLNHTWDDPDMLTSLGIMDQDEIKIIAGSNWHKSLPDQIDIRINKLVLEYDHILILGPTFPHEVVGFSGGAKYLFPGISGSDMINATHWLGALATVVGTIGIKDTPVRAMIHAAATRLKTPVTLIALIVVNHDLSGIFIGDLLDAWKAAADASSQRHIYWVDRPYKRVLSCAPTMYNELWTAAKATYKMEPAVQLGGEIIIYAPHLDVVSLVHGKYIYEAGYHILSYFLENWDSFKHIPLGVLAHSTHVRGSGTMENGIEKPNVQVTLASRITAEDCAKLNLGYLDPAKIDIEAWKNKEEEGTLYVPRAGEILYKLRETSDRGK